MFKKLYRKFLGKIDKKKITKKEISARHAVINDLFDDYYSSRFRIYRMNFFRGVFFGLGTVIGGTVVVAIVIWALSQFVDWFPYIGEYLELVIESMRSAK